LREVLILGFSVKLAK